MKIEDYTDISARCSQCNFCQAACPVFRAEGTENWLARNRLNLIREVLIEKTMTATQRFREILDTCLLCTGCTQSCSSMVPVDEIIISAKSRIAESEKGISSFKKKLVSGVMKNSTIMNLAGRAGAFVQKIGVASDNMPQLSPKPFFSRKSGTLKPEGSSGERIVYYAGCGTNFIYPETGETLVSLLLNLKREVVIPEGITCCGIPLLSEGDIDGAAAVFRKNIEILASIECDRILMECTSCIMMFIKKGVKLFNTDDPILEKITAVSSKVENALNYVDKITTAKSAAEKNSSFTYHAPCHSDKSKSGWNVTPGILSKITGAEYIPMDEPELCCGAGGTYYLKNSELSSSILKIKHENIIKTGASCVVTECPMCRFYIGKGLKNVEVLHPLEFLAKNRLPEAAGN